MLRKCIVSTLCSILTISVAHADIVVRAPYAGKEDVCQVVAGYWKGTGKAVALGIISCVYLGETDIASPAPGEMTINNLTLDLKKNESSLLCPAREQLNLKGTCHNGKMIIREDVAKLDGDMTEDGKHTKLTGTVTFTVPIIGKISPNATMDLQKS